MSVYNGGSLSGREKKNFKTIENLGEYDDQYVIERYRLDRHLIENVCDLVRAGQNF